MTLKRSTDEIYYYKSVNGLEVDFACRQSGRLAALTQVTANMKSEKTRNRKMKALLKALDETGRFALLSLRITQGLEWTSVWTAADRNPLYAPAPGRIRSAGCRRYHYRTRHILPHVWFPEDTGRKA